MFRHFANNINLITENVRGYSKTNYDSTLNNKFKFNHEYNAVKLKNKWYLIDSTWGSGYILKKKFYKKYSPYYFCVSPDLLINSHYPINHNWQLLEKPISFKQFISNLYFSNDFFVDGFYKVEPNKAYIQCPPGKYSIKVYKDNTKEIYIFRYI